MYRVPVGAASAHSISRGWGQAVPLMRRCSLGRSSGSDRQLVKEDRTGWWAAVLTNLVPTGAWQRWRFAGLRLTPGHRVTGILQLAGNLLVKQQISLRRELVGGRNDNAISRSGDGMAECVRQDHPYTRKQTGQFIWAQISVFKIQPQILKIDDVASASGGTLDSIWIKYRGGHQPGSFLRFDLVADAAPAVQK